MSGFGIDTVETFFGSITGVWGRILTYFFACWIAFGYVELGDMIVWSHNSGLQVEGNYSMWYLVPVAWGVSLIVAVAKAWWLGIPYLFYLAYVLIRVVYAEDNLWRAMCRLFAAQLGHTLLVVFPFQYIENPDAFVGYFFGHPLQALLPLLAFAAIALAWRSKIKEQEG